MKKNRLTGVLRAGAAALLCAALCGCSVKFGTRTEPKPNTKVAYATKGDDIDDLVLTYKDFSKEYKYYLELYNIEDENAEESAETCKALRKQIADTLLSEKLIMRKAKEFGLDELTEDEEEEAKRIYQSDLDTLLEYYTLLAVNEYHDAQDGADYGELTDEIKKEMGENRLNEMLEKCGLTRDDMYSWAVINIVTNKLKTKIGDEVGRSEAEESFKGIQSEAEQQYNTDPALFAQMNMQSYWLPSGARYIKHILLSFDDVTQSEIKTLRNEQKDAEADKLREEKAKELESKKEEVEKKLSEGASFDDMMKEYSAEQNADKYPDGYIALPAGGTFVKEFQETAFKLEKIGDIKSCVTDYGIHIMLYHKDATLSEEAVTGFIDYLHQQLKEVKFSQTMSEWAEEFGFERNYDALRIDKPEETSAAS